MQINLSGHHVEVSPALKKYVTTKMQRLERHSDNVTSAHVVLTVEKLNKRAEATINVSGGQIFAESVQGDMYAAIDTLADKLVRQVKKHKEKLANHHREDGGLKARTE